MKLEDKTIAQITAIFDEEIAALEKELKAAADAAVADATDASENAAEDAGQPLTPDEPVVDEDASSETPVVDEPEELEEPEEPKEPEAADDPEESEELDELETPEAPAEPEDSEELTEPATPASAKASGSPAKGILSALGYIAAIAAICVLSVVAINLLDKNIQSLKPVIPKDVPQADLAASLQSYTADEVIDQLAIPQPSLDQIYAMDLRKPSGATEADLKKVSKAGLVGLEDTFLEAEKKYGVNAIFLMSIASLESAHGTMMYRPNNMFGYGGKSYPSKEACIMDVASGLSSRYLKPGGSLYGGSPTLKGVNKRYAANPQWYAKVGKYMKSYYDVIAPYHNQSLDKIR